MPRRRVTLVTVLAVSIGIALLPDNAATERVAPAQSLGPIVSAWLDGAYRGGSCYVTPTATWSMGVPPRPAAQPPPWRVVIGGALATFPKRNLGPSDYWFVAAEPRPSIRLRATRLDRDMPVIEFDAIGRPMGDLPPAEFRRGWFYVTSPEAMDSLPTPAGCWKIELLNFDRERDVIVVELKGPVPLPNR